MSTSYPYRFGLLCLFGSTLFTSTAGLWLRWVESADGATVLFYRALFFALSMSIWLLAEQKSFSSLVNLGWKRWGVALLFAASTATFIMGMLYISVARVVALNGLMPFFAALIAWWALREKVQKGTWFGMVLALAGLLVMLPQAWQGGSWLGDSLALFSCLMAAILFVGLRNVPPRFSAATLIAAGLIVIAGSAPFAWPFAISTDDLLICAGFGIIQLGAQFVLVSIGARHVPAAEIALISRLNIPLAPIWVWLSVGEVPSQDTLIGGVLVLLAILASGVANLRAAR